MTVPPLPPHLSFGLRPPQSYSPFVAHVLAVHPHPRKHAWFSVRPPTWPGGSAQALGLGALTSLEL